MASLLPCFIILLLSIGLAHPVRQLRDVKATGPAGTLNLIHRWTDAVGSATAIFMNGPARKNSVLHSSPTSPMTEVYRNVFRGKTETCKDEDGYKCETAVNGFGGVGEVQYDFTNGIENVKGRSTQVLVACKCVGVECSKAVLIRPVNIFETLPPGANETPVERTCIYEANGNGFSDCHAELLRTVRRPVGQRPEYTHGSDSFVYTVDEQSLQLNWTARGQRGWTRDCLLSEVNALPLATMEELKQISNNTHSTPPDNGCTPPNNLVQYFREADPKAGAACYEAYEYASAAASQLASQKDEFAIGLKEETYLDAKPPLVSDTELALTCSAAGLGVLVVWGFFRARRENAHRTGVYAVRVVTMQVISYALESLPIHIALGLELHARGWSSKFAHVAGSVALGSDQLVPQGSAEGSVLIMTAVLGTVRYDSTRVGLVTAFTVAFDVAAFAIIAATLLTRRRPRPVRRYNRLMRFMRRSSSESQEEERKRLEMEERCRQQQIYNVGAHNVTSNAFVGMSSNSSTVGTESSVSVSGTPGDVDIATAAPPGGNVSHAGREGLTAAGTGPQNSNPSLRQ